MIEGEINKQKCGTEHPGPGTQTFYDVTYKNVNNCNGGGHNQGAIGPGWANNQTENESSRGPKQHDRPGAEYTDPNDCDEDLWPLVDSSEGEIGNQKEGSLEDDRSESESEPDDDDDDLMDIDDDL